MEYQVCEAELAGKLQGIVNRFIEAGWYPTGGVAVVQRGISNGWCYYQAMVRKKAGSRPVISGFGDFE